MPKHYQNIAWFDKVTAKNKMQQFFDSHGTTCLKGQSSAYILHCKNLSVSSVLLISHFPCLLHL